MIRYDAWSLGLGPVLLSMILRSLPGYDLRRDSEAAAHRRSPNG